VVVGEDARLQLADPVPAGGEREARIRLRCCSNRSSPNPASSKEPKIGSGRAASGSAELPVILSTTRPNRRLAREVEPGLGLRCTSVERIAAGEKGA